MLRREVFIDGISRTSEPTRPIYGQFLNNAAVLETTDGPVPINELKLQATDRTPGDKQAVKIQKMDAPTTAPGLSLAPLPGGETEVSRLTRRLLVWGEITDVTTTVSNYAFLGWYKPGVTPGNWDPASNNPPSLQNKVLRGYVVEIFRDPTAGTKIDPTTGNIIDPAWSKVLSDQIETDMPLKIASISLPIQGEH